MCVCVCVCVRVRVRVRALLFSTPPTASWLCLQVVERLLSMPGDYWNQFLIFDENVRSPPYNPATHKVDGTPHTPRCKPGQLEYVRGEFEWKNESEYFAC